MQKGKIVSAIVLALVMVASVYFVTTAMRTDEPKYDIDQINKGEEWKQVNNEIFISQGIYGKVNMVLVTSKGEAAVIDAGMNKEEGLRVKEYIDSNNLMVSKVFVTHNHADHVANLSMFKVSRENTYYFDNTKDNQIIKMGDRSFKILHTPGHANDSHMSVELVEDNILVAGDVLPTSLPPLINYGGDGNTLKKTLERIKKNKYALIIPGHGDLFDAKRTVEVQLEYLKKASELVKEAVESGKSLQDIRKTIKLKDCVDGPTGFGPLAQTEHLNAINKLYYEAKVEIKGVKGGKN